MRGYIAYKYKHVEDRSRLKKDLESVADVLHKEGIKSFILARDVKKWKDSHDNSLKVLPHILINLIRSDFILPVVTSNAPSTGLMLEMLFSLFFHKPIYLIKTQGVTTIIELFATKKLALTNLDELQANKAFFNEFSQKRTRKSLKRVFSTIFAIFIVTRAIFRRIS